MCSRTVMDKSTEPVLKSSEIHILCLLRQNHSHNSIFYWKLIVSCLNYLIYRTINEVLVVDDACACVCSVDVAYRFDW